MSNILTQIFLDVFPYLIFQQTETVFLMEVLDSSPTTAAQIKQWMANDPLLVKVKDLKFSKEGSVKVKGQYHLITNMILSCWYMMDAYCVVVV